MLLSSTVGAPRVATFRARCKYFFRQLVVGLCPSGLACPRDKTLDPLVGPDHPSGGAESDHLRFKSIAAPRHLSPQYNPRHAFSGLVGYSRRAILMLLGLYSFHGCNLFSFWGGWSRCSCSNSRIPSSCIVTLFQLLIYDGGYMLFVNQLFVARRH